jgi:nicotinate-nucleotide adenylyltransferase
MQKKIALFGGTFDPPHLGHIGMAKRAVAECALDSVIFIPCRQSPHKNAATAASGEARLQMLKLAFDGDPHFEASDVELHRPDPSYSWQTARHFVETLPDTELYWILGQDQWKVIDTWRRPDCLRDHLTFIVFPRDEEQPAPRNNYRSHAISYTHPASATHIRRNLPKRTDLSTLLHPAGLQFIREDHRYHLPLY